MQRIVATVLFIALLLPCAALSEEMVIVPANTDGLQLPAGSWWLVDGADWHYLTEEDIVLTDDQQSLCTAAGLTITGNVLPANSSLPLVLLTYLFPSMTTQLDTPLPLPSLTLFELSGEWFYGSDGVLYYRHDDSSALMTKDEVFAMLNGRAPSAPSDPEKVIYLTIDDSPSIYTMDLLAVLDELDVPATFFVLGAYVKRFPTFMRAIYEEGHGIANHSYSHDATNLSSSFKNCLSDFQRCEEAVADALGFALEMPILRIPYGASTLPTDFRTQLQRNGYLWIDWNALNGDTESNITTDQQALDRAISTAARYDGGPIVMLVHDGKRRTIRTMEAMVAHFREQGYVFRILQPDVEPIPGVRAGFPK